MPIKMIFIVSFMTLITFTATLYVGKRLVSDTNLPNTVQFYLWILLLSMWGSIITAQYLMRARPELHTKTAFTLFYWFALSSLGALALLVTFTVIRDLFLLPFDATKRDALKNTASLTALGFAAAGAVTGLYQARKLAGVKRQKFIIPNLPASMEGLTIAHLTDIHVGPTLRGNHLSRVVEAVNELKPDLIFLTGDLVDGKVSELKDHVSFFQNLNSKYGNFYVTGNHEYYWDAGAWVDHFRTLGIQPLLNEHRVLTLGQDKLVIAGVNDVQAKDMGEYSNDKHPAFSGTNPEAALKGAPENSIKLFLAHHPKVWDMTEGLGIHLQMSGHTHAGQFWPVTWIIHLFHKYVRGAFERPGMRSNLGQKEFLYVSAATGYWGPPNRLFNPPEIIHVTLTRQSPAEEGKGS